MSKTNLAEKIETSAEQTATVTPLPFIDPERVRFNDQGQVYKNVVVRLPDGFKADHLKQTELWKRVQGTSSALAFMDRVLCIAYDESWCTEHRVVAANRVAVTLSKPLYGVLQIESRHGALFQDETYRVAWDGAGFYVQRKADNQRMTDTVANPTLAERDLANQYIKRV